ncbi:MAG: hypothetical protein JRJ65_16705 [Deltaproteobacteria bacterium]|nr:hypothetical protein [Deltaproteobacteria bacterium]
MEKSKYRLVKLKTNTVQDLKRLMNQMGNGSLDAVINIMIRNMDARRNDLKEVGWCMEPKR